jgi:peptidoglycan/LPS O-acetylase OafA/YrhL
LFWCGVCRRLREILLDAPWSSFDLIAATTIGLIGGYFMLPFPVYDLYPIYSTLGVVSHEDALGALFLMAGIQAVLITIYCEKPPFFARLCARIAIALCFLILFCNAAIQGPPPPPSAIFWSIQFMAAVLGVARTRRHGR